MVGISYPGISSSSSAGTQPPHLAAIAPLSVIADTYRGTLYPGGILNNGFAVDWAEERQARRPSPDGQGWAQKRIDDGDADVRGQPVLRARTTTSSSDDRGEPVLRAGQLADALAPTTFVDKIDVPVFLAGAWQDEQTGGHFADMLDRFTSAPDVHFTSPTARTPTRWPGAASQRWASSSTSTSRSRIPTFPAVVRGLAPVVYASRHRHRRPRRSRPTGSTGYRATRPRSPRTRPSRRCASCSRTARRPASRARRSPRSSAASRVAAAGDRADDVVLRARRRLTRRRTPTDGDGRTRPATATTRPRSRRPTSRATVERHLGARTRTYDWQPLADGKARGVRRREPLDARRRRWSGTGSVDLWFAVDRDRHRPRR